MPNLSIFLLVIMWFVPIGLWSQEHEQTYYPVTDPVVAAKLEQWQDLKFGLLMHWGTYSQWGIVESWSICPEDYPWCERTKGSNPADYYTYRKEYEGLKNTFNPRGFDPERWAAAAATAGMKYMVFTTKHHDGFCMFDSKYTDYKVTDPACPFHDSPRANITQEIFNAFRAKGLWTGAYFSKPDWHHEAYWDPYFPPRDRNVNYDPAVYPDKWERFVQFTHNQILELVSDYGPLDILWLDGGWVAKADDNELASYRANQTIGSGFQISNKVNQDIRIDELAQKARAIKPDLIMVDRAVPGPHQNYLTPENQIPEGAITVPWESCIIAGGGWSWVPDATFRSSRELIAILVDIVSKGGNLLLNIAPGPYGDWHPEAYTRLEEIGAWMAVNGEAIYNTRLLAPYQVGPWALTQAKDGRTRYLLYRTPEGDEQLPRELSVVFMQPTVGLTVYLLGTPDKLTWKKQENGFTISIPERVRKTAGTSPVWVFKLTTGG